MQFAAPAQAMVLVSLVLVKQECNLHVKREPWPPQTILCVTPVP